MKYVIYKHTSPSGHSYVGYTKLSINKRWKAKISEVKNLDLPLSKALRKYGQENWKHEVLFETNDKDEAHEKEKEFIKKYGYYNVAEGGEGGNTGLNNNPEKITKQKESIRKRWAQLDIKERQRRIQASLDSRRANGTLGNNKPRIGEKHPKWEGYWYINHVPYITSMEAALSTGLNESTVLDLCVHKVDKVWTKTSKTVPKGKTPRECGHYKGK